MAISKRTGIIAGGMMTLAAGSVAMFMLLSSNVTHVLPTEDLQAAINSAPCGSVIELDAGQTYSGNFVLPGNNCMEAILVRSSRASELPEGQRVSPAQAGLFAKLVSPNVDPVISTGTTVAHHWKFIGVEMAPTVNNTYSIVRLETPGQASLDQVPHDLTFDRCWIHGQTDLNVQGGLTLNSASTTIINSYISDIHWLGVQSYGLGSFNGPGPFTFTNNYIAAAGLNIIFGGAKPTIAGLVPSDITITNNYLHKPIEWKDKWTVVNLLELKNAQRVVISDNLMENNWPSAQVGWAVIFNAFRDGGWEVVDDVKFVHNHIKNSTDGINLRGLDTGDTALRMHRITIADNLIEGLGSNGAEAKPFQLLGGSEDVTIDHNTVVTSTHSLVLDSVPGFSHVRLKFINNLVPHGDYGVFSNGGALGNAAMNERASDWQMEKNAFIAPPDFVLSKYPGNYFPTVAEVAIGLLGTDGLQVGVRNTISQPSPSPSATATTTSTPTPTVTPTPQPSPVSTPIPSTPLSVLTRVEITAKANIRSGPTVSTSAVGIANTNTRGWTTGTRTKDPASNFSFIFIGFDDGRKGYVADALVKNR